MDTTQLYTNYRTRLQKIADIRYAAAVLQWDQETYMPAGGADKRARQVATLTEQAHAMFTDGSIGELLTELAARGDLSDRERSNIVLSLYDYQQQLRLPGEFVRRQSETISKSFEAWMLARKQNDFKVFAPLLTEIVALKKEETDYLGYEGHRYNALLNQYERGATTKMLDAVFSAVRPPLQQLLDKIRTSRQVDDAFLYKFYPKAEQWSFGMYVLEKMGFDLTHGRQDISEHPFTTNFSSEDVRVTTRVDEHNFGNMTWSCIHELGHALYEQGLPESEYGLPLGEYASLGIHESQSRLWENNVGRSSDCWHWLYPELQRRFPEQLAKVDASYFYKAINKVEPSLIRTEADELTYHFHVIIRYELEKALMEDALTVRDIPAFWNDRYKEYLGVRVPDDKQGCLQDVHWSHGSFGYFPTYSLGSFYAAQFYQHAVKDQPEIARDIPAGGFQTLLNWLRRKIHAKGRQYLSNELCEQVTGEPLNIQYFLDYATKKYGSIYGF
jgi:carboxypeptidase Taq